MQLSIDWLIDVVNLACRKRTTNSDNANDGNGNVPLVESSLRIPAM
jgi:hypothetical protein